MDGSKITGIVFAITIALLITACKVQSPGYVGLYVDNIMVDTTMTRVVDTTTIIKAALPAFLNSAEVYQYEAEKLLKSLTDSLQLLRYQIIELQKRIALMPDTSFTEERLKEFQPLNSQQPEVDLKKPMQIKNDTIVELRKQLNELQNPAIIKVDTVYVVRETAKLPVTESQQTNYLTVELLRAKNEQIQQLQNQLNAMHSASATSRQTYSTMEPPLSSPQTDPLTLHQLRVQNDTIQFLKNQLRILQAKRLKGDSVYTEKEAEDMQFAKEVTPEQEALALQPLQDTMQFLKARVLRLEEHTLPGKDTSTFAGQNEISVPYKSTTDTTLLVAFYERGEIKPIEEESVLKQIKELCNNKNVTKITLSGYTDSSGDETINKEITNKRLNYLSEKTIPWISEEKIYFQNFGDAFASDTMVSAERRIEISILTK